MTTAPALHAIADELAKIAKAASEKDARPIDPFEIACAARKVRAQAEMIEEGLTDV